jgi:hypothetical protein
VAILMDGALGAASAVDSTPWSRRLAGGGGGPSAPDAAGSRAAAPGGGTPPQATPSAPTSTTEHWTPHHLDPLVVSYQDAARREMSRSGDFTERPRLTPLRAVARFRPVSCVNAMRSPLRATGRRRRMAIGGVRAHNVIPSPFGGHLAPSGTSRYSPYALKYGLFPALVLGAVAVACVHEPSSVPPTTPMSDPRNPQPRRIEGTVAFSRLVDYAVEELKQVDSSFIVHPRYQRAGDEIVYGLGAVRGAGLCASIDRFCLAAVSRLRLTLLEDVFGGSAVAANEHWRSSMRALREQVESLGHLDPAAFAEWERNFDDTFLELGKAVEEDAAAAKHVARREELGTATKAIGVKVHFATQPQGGRIRILKYLDYLKFQRAGKPEASLPWLSILSAEEELLGRYRYIVRWDDGRAAVGTFEVSAPKSLTFEPD